MQAQMRGDLRLGIAVSQVQGGDKSVARPAIARVKPAEGLLQARADGMALGGTSLARALDLSLGATLRKNACFPSSTCP